ncbi:DUF6177 family protein [Nocardiopsis lambiniae]|uniref:DUF6177 family protein n=1 Tax=Nocardiopsis lambiniae TaxID=3075539 RepID=A0ABU2MGA6_9ACTN|nr:DUF6177 family protein [Nocardiopsis sp. DSM 44743]MDT0331739.1 DUF6177 family protein [Nocardiopsis sp. DSM 44743]
MSYDVVALVAGEPDEQALVRALEHLDPELFLHRHGETDVLQIRDGDDHLLATLEPGQRVEHRDEIDRLLGSDISAGLPDPCWWVEVRSRPDATGREVAHRFADGLALRLGGSVWTSGTADFGLWDEPEHPAVERVATKALLVAQDRPVVPFSSWLSDAVATHSGRKMLQVLTPPTSRLTYGTRTFLAGPLGRWVVRGDSGEHYDGLTGLPVRWDDEYGFFAEREPVGPNWAAREPGAEPVPGFVENPSSITGTQIAADLSVVHGDPSSPRLGRAAEIVADHLARSAPAGWGPHEPALRRWDRERLLAFARRRAPKPLILHFTGSPGIGRTFSGQIRVSWRERKVMERISLVIGFEEAGSVPFDVLPTLVEALAEEGGLEGLRVRRLPGAEDTLYAPVWSGPAIPLGVAIGTERLERIGRRRAQAGPIKGTLLGPDGKGAAWYPALGDVESPLRTLGLVEKQLAYLSSVARA